MSRFWQKENSENTDDIGIAKDIKKSSVPYKQMLSNILWVCGSIALIVGSFWLSFLIGRRILVPIKQPPQKVQEIRKVIPIREPMAAAPVKESLSDLSPINKKIALQKSIKPKKKTAVQISRKINVKRIVIPVVQKASVKLESTPIADILYRVQIAQLYDKDAAIGLMKELQKKEFDVFARDSGNGKWYVQIGAFKDKIKARKIISDLKFKGFDNQVVIKEEK